jgi:hypothetical protein
MSSEDPSKSEFQEKLSDLVSDATADGYDVRGAYDVATADGPQFTIEITAVDTD